MNRQLTIITLLTAILGVVFTDKPLHMCDMMSCSGIHKLVSMPAPIPNLKITKTMMRAVYMQGKIDIISTSRKWMKIYCYDGSSIDGNTGCWETILDKNPKCTESRSWERESLCPTGKECAPDGDCWGSGADVCLVENPKTITKQGPTNFKWVGARWMMFPHHTCVSSWACFNLRESVDVYSDLHGGKEFFYYVDNMHRHIRIETSLFVDGKLSDGRLDCLAHEPIKETITDIEATCYGESRENIKCVLNGVDDLSGIVVDIMDGKYALFRNYVLHITGDLFVPENGKLTNIGVKGHYKGAVKPFKPIIDPTRAANLEDIEEAVNGIMAVQMQSIYNNIELAQYTQRLETIIIALIQTSSISDPMLVSKVVDNGTKYFSRWLNEKHFEVCPCIQMPEFNDGNCDGEYRYQYGSYFQRNESDKCFWFNPNNSISVSISKPVNLDLGTIKFLPPQEASSDSSSWDELNRIRDNRDNPDSYSHGGGSGGSLSSGSWGSWFLGWFSSMLYPATLLVVWGSVGARLLLRNSFL